MKKRKAGVLMLALLMVLSMLTNVFAASGAVESDRTDFLTDITGNHSAERQAKGESIYFSRFSICSRIIIFSNTSSEMII